MSAKNPESHEEIMWATHSALLDHGYANLTMRNIAAKSSKSHSLLTYHYDTKQNLIGAYLDFLVGLLETVAVESDAEDPLDRLDAFLDYFTVGTDVFPESLQVAFLEFQMLALRDEDFRTALAEHNRDNFALVADIVADGVEQGIFRGDIDADALARLVLCTVMGASQQEITNGMDGFAASVRTTLDTEVLPEVLLAEGVE